MCLTHLHLRRTGRLTDRRGFALADVLVGLVVGLMGLAVALSFDRYQLYALRNQNAQLDMQASGRAVLDLFTSEVRRAGTDPQCNRGFEAIAEATPFRVRLLADLNASGAIDATGEDVIYSYDPTYKTVQRSAGGSTVDLTAANVVISGSTLEYFDGSGAKLVPSGMPPTLSATQRAAVRRISLTLRLQRSAVDPKNPRPQLAAMGATVDVRNRYFGGTLSCQ